MVKIGPLVTKLWPRKVNYHFVKQFSPLCTGFRTYVKTAYLHINSRRFFVHKEKRTTLHKLHGSTLSAHKLVSTGPILTQLVPFESPGP